MGHEGCDVTRENSAIVLLEDKFSSLIEAIMWGREIHDMVRKLIVFQLTCNVSAVCLTLGGAIIIG